MPITGYFTNHGLVFKLMMLLVKNLLSLLVPIKESVLIFWQENMKSFCSASLYLILTGELIDAYRNLMLSMSVKNALKPNVQTTIS